MNLASEAWNNRGLIAKRLSGASLMLAAFWLMAALIMLVF